MKVWGHSFPWEGIKEHSDGSISHNAPLEVILSNSHVLKFPEMTNVGVGEADEALDLVCDRWKHTYYTGFSWEELSDVYLNIIFSDFFFEYGVHIWKRLQGDGGEVMNADCYG